MNKVSVYLLSAMLLLSACTKKEDDKVVQPNGGCTQEALAAYNDVNAKTTLYKNTPTDENLNAAKNSCLQINALMGEKSCAAVAEHTGNEMSVSYADVKSNCDIIMSIAALKNGTPAPSTSTGEVYEHGFTFLVVDDMWLNTLLNMLEDGLIEEGRFYSRSQSPDIDPDLSYCSITKNQGPQLAKGQVINWSLTVRSARDLVFDNQEGTLTLQCHKPLSAGPWVATDLQSVFGPTAKITVNP